MSSRKRPAVHANRPAPAAAGSDTYRHLDPPSIALAWPFMLAVFVAVFAVYAWSAPRTVALEDDGEFVTVVYRHGVAHPPGFPLFVLLAAPFKWLPIGSVAFRVHLASGVFGAGACAALWWIVRCLAGRSDIAVIAALAFGVSEVAWSQAIIADVYALNALLFFVLLALTLAYCARPEVRWLRGMALLAGLGLSNHWPLFTLAAPCVLVALVPARRRLMQQASAGPLALAALFLLGLLPYADMVIRSRLAPELTFAGPIASFSDAWRFLNRSAYSAVEASATAGVDDKIQFAGFLGLEAIRQLTPAGAAIAMVGVVEYWRRRSRALSLGLMAGFAGATFMLLLLISFDYSLRWRAVFKVYPVVSYGIAAVWLGLGLAALREWLAARARTVATMTVNAIGAVLVGYLVFTNAATNNRRDYDFGRDYATTLLDSFDPNAVVFAHADVDVNTLFYHHFVEGRRPDIQLFNDLGLGMTPDGPRLFDPVTTAPADQTQKIAQFARATDRPVYFLGLAPNTVSDIEYGLYRKLDRTRQGEPASSFALHPPFVEFLRRVLADRPTDLWTIEHRAVVVQQMAYMLTGAVDLGGGAYSQYRDDLERVSGELGGMVVRIELLRSQGASPDHLRSLVARARQLVDQTASPADLDRLRALEAKLR